MKKNARYKQEGFSMIEMVVYLGLVLVVVFALNSFMIDTVRIAARAMDEKEVRQGSHLIIARLTQEIKTAQTVVIPDSHHIELTGLVGTVNKFYYDNTDQSLYCDDGASVERLNNDKVDITAFAFSETAGLITFNLTARKHTAAAGVGSPYEFETFSAVSPRRGLY